MQIKDVKLTLNIISFQEVYNGGCEKNGSTGCGGCKENEGGGCKKKPLPIPGALEVSVGPVRWFRPTTVDVSGDAFFHHGFIVFSEVYIQLQK